MKKAIITGILGQDGIYLARLLLKKKYKVFGLYKNKNSKNNKFLQKEIKYIKADIRDKNSLVKILKKIRPNEIYNLAASSSVSKSFDSPIDSILTNCVGYLNILEAVKENSKKTKIFQASSSEMFANSKYNLINENTNFSPINPYGVSKVAAHSLTKFYREAYNLKCSTGILFNHESILRTEEFVSKKIVKKLYDISIKKNGILFLGNIYSKRDFGYAPEYVQAMWKILQQKKSDDFIIASGKYYSIKYFVNIVCKEFKIPFTWRGTGINEHCINKENKKIFVKIDKKLYRPLDVKPIKGNTNKANKVLKWKSTTNFKDLIKILCKDVINEKNFNP